MINCIGFLPKGIDIEKLKDYKPDQEILKKLEYLDLPIIENKEEPSEESENNDFVVESDLVVFSTPNNSELSYLQFHVFDKELDDFVIHHDIYVFSSINDTEYININNQHCVALGTFENYVMLYDALVKNPMTPQVLLEGHSGAVMAVTTDNSNYSLFSGSEDRSVIEWDLEKLCVKNKAEYCQVVEKLCVSEDILIFGNQQSIYLPSSGEEYKVEGTVENCMIEGNNIYIGDSSGVLTVLDIRNMKKSKTIKKVSEDPLTGLDVLRGYVSVSSLGGDLFIFDSSSFETKFSHNVKSELYSVKLSEENVLFFGDASDTLHIKRIEEYISF
ncbi:hypothetical protein NGRA_2368 [Nosema granulosis]|uniref:Periodic tryptophan protein 1 n=1 Tax=Nosema granulosis TaxID=83296 RepID=A0A9P6KY79_9MICR|nr:hypothetical protein NGRA_2368 [Nosema granulosis]